MSAHDREPVETLGDPDFTGVDAALRRASRRARRQAALAGEPVAVYENGEIVLEGPSAAPDADETPAAPGRRACAPHRR